MIIKATEDQAEIKKILFDDSIYPAISGNVKLDFDNTDFPMGDVLYFGGYDNGEIFALSCFHPFKDGLKFHPNVLPSHRFKYARDFVKRTAFMLKSPIYVEIPKDRKSLINLATKIGFDSIANNKDLSNRILMRLVWR